MPIQMWARWKLLAEEFFSPDGKVFIINAQTFLSTSLTWRTQCFNPRPFHGSVHTFATSTLQLQVIWIGFFHLDLTHFWFAFDSVNSISHIKSDISESDSGSFSKVLLNPICIDFFFFLLRPQPARLHWMRLWRGSNTAKSTEKAGMVGGSKHQNKSKHGGERECRQPVGGLRGLDLISIWEGGLVQAKLKGSCLNRSVFFFF